MVVGRFGSLKFICSHDKMQTFNDLERSRDIRYAQHDLIDKMPMLEFVGYGLYKTSFSMRFDLTLGVSPYDCLEKLKKMMENRQYKWLVIGEKFFGRYIIESIAEEHRAFMPDGTLLVVEVKLNLIEWSRGK